MHSIEEIYFPYKSQNGKTYLIHTYPSGKGDYGFRTSKTFFVHDYPWGKSGEHLTKFKLIAVGHYLDEFGSQIKETILTRMGLSILFKELEKDDFPKSIEKNIKEDDFAITPHNWFISYPKICSYRKKKNNKYFCTADNSGEVEVLEHKCEKCALPEEFLRCKHVMLKANFSDINKKTYSFECRLGKQIKNEDPYNCINPQQQPCFEDLIVFSSEQSLDKRTELIRDVKHTINRTLRKAMGDKRPEKEDEVKKQINVILSAKDFMFKEEDPQYLFSVKRYRPDLTSDDMSIAIEVKLVNSKADVKRSVQEISEDIAPYRKKFRDVIFVIYDLGFIEDIQDYKIDFEKIEGVHVVIVKH